MRRKRERENKEERQNLGRKVKREERRMRREVGVDQMAVVGLDGKEEGLLVKQTIVVKTSNWKDEWKRSRSGCECRGVRKRVFWRVYVGHTPHPSLAENKD